MNSHLLRKLIGKLLPMHKSAFLLNELKKKKNVAKRYPNELHNQQTDGSSTVE